MNRILVTKDLGVFKKAVAALTVSATVLSLAGFAVALPASAAAPADYGLKEGDVISAAGSDDPDVYIVNEMGYKRLFLNPAIFGFYGHLGGFAAVKNVSPATRDAFPTSGLFQNCETGDPKVYGVETTGEDVGMLHWVNTTGAQAVADDPNFFKKVFCINNNEFSWYSKGSDYTSVNQVPSYSRSGQQAGSLSVGLASDNPVAGTLVAGQALADLAHFWFQGSGTVTKIKLKRTGVSADNTLSNVYLFEGARRLTDASTVTSGEITFNDPNGLFSVPGSLNLKVKADILSTATGQTVGVQLLSYTMGGVDYTVSVSGNNHTIATASLASADFPTASPAPAAATIDPQDDYVMWQNTATIGTRYVWLKSFRLRQIGSVLPGDLSNFRLQVDGVTVGTAVASLDSNGYVNFDFGAGVKLETGGRVMKLLGNIVNGSNRNFSFSLQRASDVEFVDSEFMQPILTTVNTGAFSPRTTGAQTIANGTLTVTKMTDSATGDVVKDASGVSLGKWEFKAAGEKIKVENLRAAVDPSTEGTNGDFTLRNGALFANGVQIGSTQSLCSVEDDSCSGYSAGASLSYTEYSLGSALVVTPGTPVVVELRADIYDNDNANDIAAGVTLEARLQVGSTNAQRLVSLGYVNAPSALVAANTVTVRTGSTTVAKYTAYANQNINIPKSNVKLGSYVLTGNSSEDVNVNTIAVGFDEAGTFLATTLSDVKLRVLNSAGSLVVETAPKGTVSATSSSSYSVNFSLPKNQSYTIEVWGSVGSFTVAGNDDTMTTQVSVTGTTAQSASATSGEATGQTLTAATGSITSAVDGSTPVAKLVAGGQTVNAAAWKFSAANDDFRIHQVVVAVDNANSAGAVSTVVLKDGGTVVGSLPLSGTTVTFSGLNVMVPKDGDKVLTGDVVLGAVGIGGASSSVDAKLTMNSFKAYDSNGAETTDSNTRAGNTVSVVKAYPQISTVALPTTVLNAGEQTLAKFVVSGVGAEIGWKQITFTFSKTSPVALSSNSYKLFEDGVEITSLVNDTASTSLGVGFTSGTLELTAQSERPVGTNGKTYELKATVAGSLTAGDNIQTKIANPSGTTPNGLPNRAYATVAATTASFVWTDKSDNSHSTTTADWFNEALVKDLPTNQALTK
jgi:hypothetical protein